MARARLEAEAQRATQASGTGRRVPFESLSATEPARPLGGTGAPLPTSVRERLETMFSADLAAVRIHHGGLRGEAESERGLAAGVHVYLGAGESADRAESFPVLAHEVAHVLQQAGAVREDGGVEVRPAQGSADALGWVAPFARPPSPLPVTSLIAAWLGTAIEAGDTEAETHIRALQAAHDAASAPDEFWTARADHVVARRVDPALGGAGGTMFADLPQLAMAALYDGLKRTGRSLAAAHILKEDENVPTLLLDPDTYVAWVGLAGEQQLLNRILSFWAHHPLLSEARPERALALSFSWLIGTYGEVPKTPLVTNADPTLTTYLVEDIADAIESAGMLTANEFLTAALTAVVQLERVRLEQLRPPDDGARVVITGDDRLDTRVTIAARLLAWAREVEARSAAIQSGSELAALTQETRYLLVRDLGPALAHLAEFALEFWRLGALADAAQRGQSAEGAAARGVDAQTLSRIGSSPEPFPGLAADWLAHVQAFFERAPDGSLPAPQEYDTRVRAAVRAADALAELVRQRVRAIARAAFTNVPGRPLAFDRSRIAAEQEPILAMAAWLLVGLRFYRARLESYDKAEDQAFAARWGPRVQALNPPVAGWPGDDLRVLHRGRFARGALEVAAAAGLTAVADVLRPIVSATEVWAQGAQAEDVLAIAAPYSPEPDTPISQLTTDQGAQRIAGWEQFSTHTLVSFFQGDHYRRLTARIDELLGGEEGQRFAIDQIPIINQARTAERESLLHPLRHSIHPDHFVYLHRTTEDDGGPPPTGEREPLRRLIEQHPITRHTVKDWHTYLVPVNQMRPELVLWRLPDLAGMARFLRAIPAVNQLLARFAIAHATAGAPAPSADQFAQMPDLTWWSWWTRLTETDAAELERRQVVTLQAIPEVTERLASYAAEDVVAPNSPPSAAELAAMSADDWNRWFIRLTDVADERTWEERNTAFRDIQAVNVALAGFATRQAAPGDVVPSAADLASLGRQAWLEQWKRLMFVGTMRRSLLSRAIRASDLSTALGEERTAAWDELWAAQRRALVHERERVIRTRVEPLLHAHDQRAQSTARASVNGRAVSKRRAALKAIEELQSYFLYTIDDEEERAAHQAAAFLRIALLARDKLVREDSDSETGWSMQGWDRNMALWWMPFLDEVLVRLDAKPALDPWLREDEPPATWIPERTTALENIYDGMVWTLTSNQEDFGIFAAQGDGTIENPGAVYQVHDSGRTNAFGPGHAFRIDGVTWEVTEVVKEFRFHPAIIRVDGREIRPSIFKFDGATYQGADAYTGTLLLRVDRDGQLLEVKHDAEGDATLRELSHAVAMASIVEQLMALHDLMEEGTMFAVGLALDIVALFPVAGQAAEVARVSAAVGRVVLEIADPNSDTRLLVEALVNDPVEALEGAWRLVRQNLAADQLLTTLLVEPGAERLESLAPDPPPRAGRVRGTTSTVGRILRRIVHLGRSVIRALARVVGFAHDVRDDAQALVFEHLLLGRALGLIAEHLRFLSDLPDVLQQLENVPGDVAGTVKRQFDELVAAMGQIRMPGQLVTLDDIVNLLLDLIAKSLGGKYRLGYEVIKGLLRHVGKWDWVVGQLSGAIETALGFDPSAELDFWSDFINDRLGPYVRQAQAAVHQVLSPIYAALPGVTDTLAPVPSGPLNIASAGNQFLDAAPQQRPGAEPARAPERVELSSGRPLDDEEVGLFQRQFGQDVSHVRVHTDSAAARATEAAGARALTTGSHVLLAPDVRLDGDAGWRTLSHEVVHVLQQTGPRPLGISDERPVTGEPNRGLRVDRAAEAEADALAEREEGARIVVPVGLRGLQPDFIDTGQRFIDYLLHGERARPEIERIERTGGGTGGVLIGREVREDVRQVGPSIGRWIDAFSTAKIEPRVAETFRPAVREIKAWLATRKTAINQAVEDLAIDSSEAVRRRSDARESPEMELREEGFERKLQRFVMIATGCSIDFELNKNANGRLNRQNPLSSARFVGMNLALVPDNVAEGAALWTKVMRNTFPASVRNEPHARAMARILLLARGMAEDVWDPARFKLIDSLAGQIRGEAEAIKDLVLPNAAQFWHGETRPAGLALTQPALWVGLHGDATHHGMPDRQSHHTTQFLLVQYFEMDHGLKPFPNPAHASARAWMAQGLSTRWSRNYVDAVGPIEVGSLDRTGHRGAGMPALLMAAVTHRRGYLHVAPITGGVAEEDEEPIRPTQGRAVDRWFRTALESELGEGVAAAYWRAVEATYAQPTAAPSGSGTTPTTIDPAADPAGWLDAHGTELRRAIPAAMRATYGEMKGVMLNKIEPALKTLEVTWYQELAAAKGHADDPAYQVRSEHVSAVARAAENNNRAVMETQAHWANP